MTKGVNVKKFQTSLNPVISFEHLKITPPCRERENALPHSCIRVAPESQATCQGPQALTGAHTCTTSALLPRVAQPSQQICPM